jgi:tRNA (adenine37-N6)-methyltransferase
MFEKRDGEISLATDPAAMPPDGHIVFIGRIRSPWKSRADCPKNMAAARERGLTATVEVGEPFRPGLEGLSGASHVIILSWFHHAPRNLIVQKPRHATEPKGVLPCAPLPGRTRSACMWRS